MNKTMNPPAGRLTETMTEATKFDRDVEELSSQGFCEGCSGRLAYAMATPWCFTTIKPVLCAACDKLTTPSLAGLLRAAYAYSDWNIQKDLDTILAEALTNGDRLALRRYAKSRINGRGFAPGKANANNHTKALAVKVADVKPCECCGKGFAPKRSDAKYCGGSCYRVSHRMANRAA